MHTERLSQQKKWGSGEGSSDGGGRGKGGGGKGRMGEKEKGLDWEKNNIIKIVDQRIFFH